VCVSRNRLQFALGAFRLRRPTHVSHTLSVPRGHTHSYRHTARLCIPINRTSKFCKTALLRGPQHITSRPMTAGRLCVVVATAQAGPVGNPLIKGPRSPWEPCCRSRQVSTRNSPSPQKPCVANSSQKRSILAAAACHRMEVFLPPAVWSLSDWPHRSVCSRVMVRWPHAVRLQLSESRWCWGGGRWSGKRSRP